MTQGENTIVRASTENQFFVKDTTSSYAVYEKVLHALEGHEQFVYDNSYKIDSFPQRLLLPKGKLMKLFLS